MPKNPSYHKNLHIKRIKFNLDLSNNNILDSSNINLSFNHYLQPLQNCNRENFKNIKCANLSNKTYDQKNINKRVDYFKRRMDTILEQLRKERETNTPKNLKYNRYQKFIKTLDDASNNNEQVNYKKPTTSSKEDFDDLLKKINNKYDLLNSDNIRLSNPKLLTDKPLLKKEKKIMPYSIFGDQPYQNKSPFRPQPLIKTPIALHIRENKISPPPPPKVIRKVIIDREINNIDDILKLIDDFPLSEDVEYNIDMKAVHKIKDPLFELNSMIGMKELKNNIVDQIIYFMQNFHTTQQKTQDFMHTVIYGPPGTGKTEIAKIMGKIFCNMGVLKRNVFRKATRSDLIAGYLGQTAMKTRDMMRDCMGGVLFIDEAYALGNPEKRDSFAKECIDTLCEGLSDNKDNLMVIIAGYEEDLKKCFFAYNQGLDSRLPWRFKTDDYDAHDLNLIFQKKIKDAGWSLKASLEDKWFKDNMDYFKYYGRDMETLFSKTKIAHSRRVFCKKQERKTKLTKADLDRGLQMFLNNGEVKSRKDGDNNVTEFMYM